MADASWPPSGLGSAFNQSSTSSPRNTISTLSKARAGKGLEGFLLFEIFLPSKNNHFQYSQGPPQGWEGRGEKEREGEGGQGVVKMDSSLSLAFSNGYWLEQRNRQILNADKG